MAKIMKSKANYCEDCIRISCKKCYWIATAEDVLKIQKNELTACPLCGWKPK